MDNPIYMSEKEEKLAIAQRLREYRAANGLGCLIELSNATKTKKRISDSVLRDILIGNYPSMQIEDWRKIGRGLDKLETLKTCAN